MPSPLNKDGQTSATLSLVIQDLISLRNMLGGDGAAGVGGKQLVGSATWNPGEIADGDMESKDVAVVGAALGDFARASFSLDVVDLGISAAVTAADVVTVTLLNNTGAAVDLGSGTVRVITTSSGATAMPARVTQE